MNMQFRLRAAHSSSYAHRPRPLCAVLNPGSVIIVPMISVFSSPSRYTQGPNATAVLGQEMKALGLEGPVLIVAGRSARKLLGGVWPTALGDAGYTHAVHDFGGECSHAEIARIVASARHHNARTIAGAGGGKVLDAARAAAATSMRGLSTATSCTRVPSSPTGCCNGSRDCK